MGIILAQENAVIKGFLMFHEADKMIVVDYVSVRDTETGGLLLKKMSLQLQERARTLDVPVVFEVQSPIAGDDNRNRARVRLFEGLGAKVIGDLDYMAPDMDHFPNPDGEEKYLIMYGRPGRVPTQLPQSEVREIVEFLYKTWYQNWFSHRIDEAKLEAYLEDLAQRVIATIPASCPRVAYPRPVTSCLQENSTLTHTKLLLPSTTRKPMPK